MRYFLTITLLIVLSFEIKAEIILTDSTKRLAFGKQIFYLQGNKEYSFEDVIKIPDQFKQSTSDVPNLGISGFSTWITFDISNKSSSINYLLDITYPILDEVELFIPDSLNLHYSRILISEKQNFELRKYNDPNYIFDLLIPENSTRKFFLRIKSAEQIILPISVNKPVSLWEQHNTDNLISGIYGGIMIIMFFYNLFVFFTVRDRSYLFYVIYVACAGLTQIGIKGYNFQYFWYNYPEFEIRSTILFACLSGIFALYFTKNFLQSKINARKSDIFMSVLIGLYLVSFLITIIGAIQIGFQIMQLTTTLTAITMLIVSYVLMRQGFSPAKFFLLAWSVLLIGALIFLLKDYSILPYNLFTSYSMQGASALETSLLSFALADRINIFRKEKESAQMESLTAAQENERIIREQNIILETKVTERTLELNNTLGELKNAQTLIVESEKMASLGQLTAGIAHEINNPINFVTSNVKPLRRDVEIIFEAFDRIELLAMSDEGIEVKKQLITDIKKEIEIDYLKTEIDYLMKGIYEGSSRTAEIVKGLRIFSRLDEADLKSADINEGLDSTIIIVNNLLNNNIDVKKNYNISQLVDCYPGKLNQVFLNIITNSIYAIKQKFGDKPGGILSIKTNTDAAKAYISIKDNGSGMSEETKNKIFEPFFTTKPVGEGTGLGLSITYNTIKKHSGNIKVNSVLGEGTEFILEIPLVQHLS